MPFASIVFFSSFLLFDSFYMNPGHFCTCFSSETLLLSSLLFLWSPFSQWLLHGEILCLTFSCCHVETQLKLFILQRGQVISYENSETWPMPRKHELMMNSINLDSICFCKPLTQVTYSCPLYHGSWLPKLLQTHGNSACHHQKSQTLEKTWHPFDTVHAMLKRLSSKHTKHVLRQERVVWQPSKFDEVNLDAALYFRQMQR